MDFKPPDCNQKPRLIRSSDASPFTTTGAAGVEEESSAVNKQIDSHAFKRRPDGLTRRDKEWLRRGCGLKGRADLK